MLGYIYRLKCKTCLLILFLTIFVIYNGLKVSVPKVKQKNYPIILWWTPFLLENERVINCVTHRCLLTNNRTYASHKHLKAFLFYGSDFKLYDIPSQKHIPWAIYHEESPKNLALFLNKDGQNLFNIFATFSRKSNFPLTLQYLKDLNFLTDLDYYVTVQKKNLLLKTISPILYLQSSCDTPSERDSYVLELMKYVKVDSYGACINNKKLPETLQDRTKVEIYDENLLHFIAKYKFIIAIENAVCEDYITEKLWRALAVGSIPIYLGSPSVQDWLPFNNSAILIQDYKNIEDLSKHIHKVNEDDQLYNSHLRHKLTNEKIRNKLLLQTFEKRPYGAGKDFEHSISAFECYVCESVHQQNSFKPPDSVYECPKPNSLDSSWKNHWVFGKCEIKTLKYFTQVVHLENITQEMFAAQAFKFFQNNECETTK